MWCDGGIVWIRDLKATSLFGYLRVYASLLVLYVDKAGLIVIRNEVLYIIYATTPSNGIRRTNEGLEMAQV